MRWNRMVSVFMVSLLLLSACGTRVDKPDKPTKIDVVQQVLEIDLNQELQTMDGFGASDAWRCQMVGKYWPLEKKNAIADLLFSKDFDEQGNPKGIGLSMWRYYLGAGSMEQGDKSNISNVWRRAECYQNAAGSYDWTKGEGQRWFLQAAKLRGVQKFLAFTISPPVHMTANGYAFATKKQQEMNIKPGKLPAYADFLVSCIEHLQNSEGIQFDYLSPINEPQWDWMAGSDGKNSQEGTPATNQNLYDFTVLLSEKLKAKALQTKIVLGEAAQINYLSGNVNDEDRDDQIREFWDPASNRYLGNLSNVEHIISAHSYFTTWPIDEQVSSRQALNNRMKQYAPVRYWQSEYCVLENPGESEIPGGSGNGRDLGMKTALYVARIIHNDLTVANASSWQWWTALTQADYKDGLIYLDDNGSTADWWNPEHCKQDGNYRDSKLLWTLGNYSLFIRPNMTRVQVLNQDPVSSSSNLMVSAYTDKQTKKLIVVAVNVSSSSRKCSLNLGSASIDELTPYETSETKNLSVMPRVKSADFDVPARAVVTYVGTYK